MAHPTARWRVRSASLTVSLAAHVIVLAALLAGLSVRPPPDRRLIVVQLVPLTPLRQMRAPRPSSPRSTAAPQASAPVRTATSPTPQASGLAAPPAPAPGGAGDLSKVRGMLRGAMGCSHPELVKLTDAERAACDRKMLAGIDPNVAWPAPIAPEKRAWFDATMVARNTPGRMPALGCGVAFSGVKLIKPRGPPHSIKLGPLPCFIVAPKGPFDEDVDVPPPSKNGPSYEGQAVRPPPGIPDYSGGSGPTY